jgi:hypothetical protein
MEEELKEAIDKLTDQIAKLGRDIGNKGSSTGGNRTKSANKASGASDDVAKKLNSLGATAKGTSKSLGDMTGANAKLITSSTKLNWQQKATQNRLKSFGAGLADAGKSGQDSLKQLSGALINGSSTFTKVLGKFALGLGFAWGTLENFAEAARSASGALNLGAVSVGLMQTQSMMSGLGKEFATVINESGGGFKLLGATTEDAVKNLSQMSRAVRNGSSMMGNLTKAHGVSAKSVNETAKLTAQLGLTEKQSASLMAAGLDVARRAGVDQDKAMQVAIKSYATTAKTARGLSDQFGVSAHAIMQASMAFQKSIAGQRAANLGVGSDATEIQGVMGQLLGNLSQDQRDRASAAMAAGQTGQAVAIATEGKTGAEAAAIASAIAMMDTGQKTKGDGTLLDAMKSMESASMNTWASNENFVDTNMNAAAGIGLAFKRLSDTTNKSDKDAEANSKKGKTTEAGNIESLTNMKTSVDFAKGAFWGLVAGGVGLLGTFMSLAAAGSAAALSIGGSGGMLKGLFGSVKDGFSKMTSGAIGGGLKGAKSVVGGVASKPGLLGKAGGFVKGMMGGGGTTPEMPSTSGLTKSTAALGKFGEKTKSVGSMIKDTMGGIGSGLSKLFKGIGEGMTSFGKGIAGLAKGIGSAMTSIGAGAAKLGSGLGKGIGKLVQYSLEGIGKGLSAVSNPKYFIGAAVLAAVGGAMWIAGKAFQQFSNINWGGVIAGGIALGVVTAGAALIGASGMIAPIMLGALAIGVLGAALIPFAFAAGLAGEAMIDLGYGLQMIGTVPIGTLLALGPALALMGVGLAALAGGGALSSFMGMFQSEGPIDKIVKIAGAAKGVQLMATSVARFGRNLMIFNKGLEGVSETALDKLDSFIDMTSNISSDAVNGIGDLAISMMMLSTSLNNTDFNKLNLPLDLADRYHDLAAGILVTASALDQLPKPSMWDTIIAGVGSLFAKDPEQPKALSSATVSESIQLEKEETTTYADGRTETTKETLTVLQSIEGHISRAEKNTRPQTLIGSPRVSG